MKLNTDYVRYNCGETIWVFTKYCHILSLSHIPPRGTQTIQLIFEIWILKDLFLIFFPFFVLYVVDHPNWTETEPWTFKTNILLLLHQPSCAPVVFLRAMVHIVYKITSITTITTNHHSNRVCSINWTKSTPQSIPKYYKSLPVIVGQQLSLSKWEMATSWSHRCPHHAQKIHHTLLL